MSAVDTYREHTRYHGPGNASTVPQRLAEAAITELEATLETCLTNTENALAADQQRIGELQDQLDECKRRRDRDREKLRQAEADLAAMTKERDLRNDLLHASNEELRRDLAAAREEARHMQGDALVIREVAERITKEGTDAPFDSLWMYERMCEVIEVIDSGYLLARYQPEEDV